MIISDLGTSIRQLTSPYNSLIYTNFSRLTCHVTNKKEKTIKSGLTLTVGDMDNESCIIQIVKLHYK